MPIFPCRCTVCPVHAHQPRFAVDAGPRTWPRWTSPTLQPLTSVVTWLDGREAMAAGHVGAGDPLAGRLTGDLPAAPARSSG